MSGKTRKTSKFAAAVLIIVNFTVMLFSTLLFTFGLWTISSPVTLSAILHGFGNPTVNALLSPPTLTLQLGLSAAALATFFFFLAFMGLYGAIGRSQFLLFMYAALVLLLLLLECALMYYFSSNLVEKGINEDDGQWAHALRLAFQCCDHNSTAIQEEAIKPPWSCCGAESYPNNCTTNLIYKQNCNDVIPVWLYRYQTAIYASLAVLHIILASCSLLRRSRNNVSQSYS